MQAERKIKITLENYKKIPELIKDCFALKMRCDDLYVNGFNNSFSHTFVKAGGKYLVYSHYDYMRKHDDEGYFTTNFKNVCYMIEDGFLQCLDYGGKFTLTELVNVSSLQGAITNVPDFSRNYTKMPKESYWVVEKDVEEPPAQPKQSVKKMRVPNFSHNYKKMLGRKTRAPRKRTSQIKVDFRKMI